MNAHETKKKIPSPLGEGQGEGKALPRRSYLSTLSSKQGVNNARNLRANATDAEKLLWSRLRARQLNGWKFRRQVPLQNYIADFLCEEAKLIVELDGGQHADQVEKDNARTASLNALGYRGGAVLE